MAHTVFVIGMDDFNRAKLDRIEASSDIAFEGLYSLEHIRERQFGSVASLLEEAANELEAFRSTPTNTIDGIIAYWDFPVQTMVPILRDRFGLPGPSLESVLKCEHKYWSRVEQRRVVPDYVPEFQWFDPFDDPVEQIGSAFPFWIKPVKATNSQLGFMIRDQDDLEFALETVRAQIGRFGDWFDQFLARADLPAEIAPVSARHCVAESILSGTQHTLSGWVDGNAICTYGVVDSHNYPGRSSFSRYQYPSVLEAAVKDRMAGISALLMESLDFEHEAFNIEFFYDRDTDHLAILEVNPRISQSHGDMYEKVDGLPNHKIAADLSLGRKPDFPFREGTYDVAAKFYLRAFEDAVVASTPTRSDVERVERDVDGAIVDVMVSTGDRLLDAQERDSYSFELAHVYVGGSTEDELIEKYERCVDMLEFELTSP